MGWREVEWSIGHVDSPDAICQLPKTPAASTALSHSFSLSYHRPNHRPNQPHFFLPPAVACPVNTVGTDLATNDCTPAPGFHGVTTATATAPYYATNTVNGADVQACTSQVGCDTDTADTCTTGANKALLQCTAMLAGYSSDGDGMVTGE